MLLEKLKSALLIADIYFITACLNCFVVNKTKVPKIYLFLLLICDIALWMVFHFGYNMVGVVKTYSQRPTT